MEDNSLGISRNARLLALALLLVTAGFAGAASAANAPTQPNAATTPKATDPELDEILVNGKRIKPERNMQAVVDWMRRLVGQFRYQGYVELRSPDGAPLGKQDVQGISDCVAFGLAPGVQCSVKVEWPAVEGSDRLVGAVSTLQPAMILYGFDPDHRAVHMLQVDNKGIADGALGYIQGDTLIAAAPCEGIPGNCQRITRITAKPDGKLIQTQIDIEIDGQRVTRYLFLQRPKMKFVDDDAADAKAK
jgi:hypothetical protein